MKDRNILSNYWSIVLLVISVPFISYFIILIWPTFDAWYVFLCYLQLFRTALLCLLQKMLKPNSAPTFSL